MFDILMAFFLVICDLLDAEHTCRERVAGFKKK